MGEACIICIEHVLEGKSAKPYILNCTCFVSIHENCWKEYYEKKGMECPFCHTRNIRIDVNEERVRKAGEDAATCCCFCGSIYAGIITILGCIFG
jgi:hypothetical protein